MKLTKPEVKILKADNYKDLEKAINYWLETRKWGLYGGVSCDNGILFATLGKKRERVDKV